MEEQGIHPDLIVTNSMGSIIGLLYAAGVPVDVMEDMFRRVDYSQLFTGKLPSSGGLMDMRGLLALTRELVGEIDISELPIPVIAVCEDLRTMRRVILCRGDFLTVLQAAIAIPAVFETVDTEGMLLIDGGASNLVPLSAFMELAEVNISSTAFYNRNHEPSDPLSVLHTTFNITKSRSAVEDIKRFKPFLIRNDVEHFTYMGWRQMEEIILKGYQSCDDRIEALEHLLHERGIKTPLPVPQYQQPYRERYESRWAEIYRKLTAGQPLYLPEGFGAVQIHLQLMKLYRRDNRLEQNNYLGLSYLYERGYGSVQFGALSDLGQKWGLHLDLDTALWGRLLLGLHNFFFFTWDGTEASQPYTYQHLRLSLPCLAGPRLLLRPFTGAELSISLPDGEENLFIESGLDLRLFSLQNEDFLQERLAYFIGLPGIHGLANELMVRKRIIGPLHVYSRVLLRSCFDPGVNKALTLTHNDFFRGLGRGIDMGSFAVMNNDIILAPESLFFTLWETFMFKGFELSGFCDLFLPEAVELSQELEPSFGLSLKAELALMGLFTTTAVFSGGYDMGTEAPFFSLNLGAVY
jgi:NTE family protein